VAPPLSSSGEDLATSATVQPSSTTAVPEALVTVASQAVIAARTALQFVQQHQKLQLQSQVPWTSPPPGDDRVEAPMLGQVKPEPAERIEGPQDAEVERCSSASKVASSHQSRPLCDDSGIQAGMQDITQRFGAVGTMEVSTSEDYDTCVTIYTPRRLYSDGLRCDGTHGARI